MKLKFRVPVYHLSVCSKVSSCVLRSICSLIFSFSFPWLLWLSKWSQWAGHGLGIVKCSQDCRIYCWQQHDFLNSNAGMNESCRERALPQTSKRTSSLQVTASAEFPDPSLPLWSGTVLSCVFAGSWGCLNQTQGFRLGFLLLWTASYWVMSNGLCELFGLFVTCFSGIGWPEQFQSLVFTGFGLLQCRYFLCRKCT